MRAHRLPSALLALASAGLAVALSGACRAPAATDQTPPSADSATTTVYLVRHAEKQRELADPLLSPEGEVRAQALAETLRSVALDAVYSTDTRRTRATAAPVVEAQSLPLKLYDHRDPAELDQLVTTLRSQPGRYLVVGHSNTTPELVALLGGEPGPAIDEASEFDRLYVLVLLPGDRTITELLRYGP
ncbi:MAG: phosphoglycerate mutase family protein [Haliangiales bacterium]